MSLIINHNMMAMNAARNLGTVYDRLASSTQKLSSGLRVNSAADDAAGLAIREQMRADIAVLNQGIRNASDAISMIQTAEGAMSVIDEKLTRMKELAEQAATGTYTTAQREIINSEYQAMAAEIDRIANATSFNGVKLLDGSMAQSHEGSGMKIHFGLGNKSTEDYYYVNVGDVRATIETGLRVGNSDPRDTIRTTTLKAASQIDPLDPGDAAGKGDGFFGIRYTEDFNAESTANDAKWNLYGYVDIDASRTSINEMVQNINKGAQAQGSMSFSAATAGTNLNALSVTINGQIFGMSTVDDIGTYSGSTGTIGMAAATDPDTMAAQFANYINNKAASIGVYAAVQGSTVHFVAHEFGEGGNTIETSINSNVVKMTQTSLTGGGRKVLTASAAYNAENDNWELQLQMNKGGEKNQIQTFGFATAGQTTSATIMGGIITGVEFTDDNRWMSTLSKSADLTDLTDNGKVTVYSGVDALNEWIQPQNGSGRTEWDGADLLTQSAAQKALGALDGAITKKDTARANLGAIQNRLENTITTMQIQAENLQAAESRISDVDVATEMTEFTRNNILAQAATAMLAQANSLPQLALSLIG